MWDSILDFSIKLVVPAIAAFSFILVKKGCQIISRKLDIEVSAKEWEIIDRFVEEAVRAVEEDSKVKSLSSEEKEELALTRIKGSSVKGFVGGFDESLLRTKVRACVNKLYNHGRLGKIKQV